MHSPSKSIRGGYIVVFFGVLILVYGALSGYGVWKASRVGDPAKYHDVVETLSWSCAVSTLFGLVLIFVGWKLVKSVREFNELGPD
jgi:uncharacterized membrane protein YidH (DUF202 family)